MINFRTLLEAEQFSKLEIEINKLIGEFESGKTLDRPIGDAFKAFASGDVKHKERIDQWIDERPRSSLAYLARCRYYEAVGWLHRGQGFVSVTPEDSFKSMRASFFPAILDCNKAISLNNKLSLAYSLVMEMAMALGQDSVLKAIASNGFFHVPNSYLIHDQYFFSHTSRWGGSIDELHSAINSRFEVLTKIDELSPLLGFDLYYKARESQLNDDYQSALAFFKRAEKEYHLDTQLEQASMLMELGKETEATHIYTQAINNGTVSPKPYMQMAILMSSKERYEEAINYLNKLIEIEPNNPNNLTYRGVTYLWMKQPEQAQTDFEKSMIYGQNNAYSRFYRGKSYLYKNKNEARKDLQAAYGLRPDISKYAFYYGVVLYEQKDCLYIEPFETYESLCSETDCDKKKVDWVKEVLLKAKESCH
ncbi:MAG: DUF4034 domain-containing protein [Gammaproteobacteria bacterium]|nr:DUF4034 domain-containing protein [Gammaproteobacteria bacterium]